MFPDFIKHYDMIRSILRDVFLYGCFSKSDLENKNNNSSRKISYEMRRIRQYIESDFIRVDKDGKNKLLNLSYDNITNTRNFLVDTYLSKSFTKSDIALYYYLLLVLNYINKPMTFSEIEDTLIKEGLIDYDEISSKTIERKLNEMCNSMEIINFRKRGRAKEYFIAEDILKELTNEEVLKLFYIADLYKNIIYPNISGYYFYDTLKDYMEFERNVDFKENDIFQYEYLHFHPVIEEELVLKIMRAIENKNEIILKSSSKARTYKKYDNEPLKPIKLRYDIECGRFYVIGFCRGRCMAARLDRKEDVKILKTTFDYDEYFEKYKKSMEKSFSSVPNNNNNPYFNIILELRLNNENEKYLVEKIKGELGECTIEAIDENKYIIEKEVNDGWEMIPWIRKYGGNLRVIEPSKLRKKLQEDWEAMLSNYGVIS